MSYYIGKNSARHTLQGVVALLESLCVHVNFGKVTAKGFEGAEGLTEGKFSYRPFSSDHKYEAAEYHVTIDRDLSLEEQKLTLSHEMAHVILGHLAGGTIESDYNISHEQKEFEAEALGLMLCNFLFGFNGESKEQKAARGFIEMSSDNNCAIALNNNFCEENSDMSEKIKTIAGDDLTEISIFLSKIQASAQSTYSYIDHLICEPRDEKINDFMYMLDVIKDISKTADSRLSEIMDKLYSISYEMEAAV